MALLSTLTKVSYPELTWSPCGHVPRVPAHVVGTLCMRPVRVKGRRKIAAGFPSEEEAVLPPGREGATRTAVVHVTGVTVTYVGDHGDPYVFPAGFAEQDHPVQERIRDHPEP